MAKKFRRRAQFLLHICILLGANSPSFARAKRYIVKIGASGYAGQSTRALMAVRSSNLSSVAKEVDLNVPGSRSVFKAKKFGMLIVESSANDGLLESALAQHPYVKYFEEDYLFQVNSANVTGASGNSCDSSFSRTGTRNCITNPSPSSFSLSPWLRDVLGMEAGSPAADIEYVGNTPTIVAVIDTGAMVAHPFLKHAIARNSQEFSGQTNVDNDGNGVIDDIYGASFTVNSAGALEVSGDPSDNGTDHGTHVAGTIKSIRDQAIASLGTGTSAPQRVQILPIRFINESQVGSTSGAIAALEYAATRGAKVVNCSWGAKGTEAFTESLYDAFKEAYEVHDMLITIAAGNAERFGANNNDLIPYFPSSMNVPSIISVASVTAEYRSGSETGGSLASNPSISDFSNYGANSVHIAAPGGFKDQNGNSDGVSSANARLMDSNGSIYTRKKGTSMAAPVVAGIAGVVRALNPGLTSYEVKKLLMETAETRNVGANVASNVSSKGMVSAAKAFEEAQNIDTRGEKPPVEGEPYYTYQSSASTTAPSKSSGGGGCGALHPMSTGGSSNGNGPLGGNSLLLFSTMYLIGFFIRSLQRRKAKGRV